MAGYFYEKTTHTMPVFINYIAPDKKEWIILMNF